MPCPRLEDTPIELDEAVFKKFERKFAREIGGHVP
jgi:hypothetical protein